MPASPSAVPIGSATLCIALIFLVPFAAAGLALVNTGLGRSRSAAHLMMSSLCVFAVAVLVYFACGFAFQSFPGEPAHIFHAGGRDWNWLGARGFFLSRVALDGSPVSLAALLGIFAVALAALIPLGAGADRWRLGPSCASAALLAGVTYPIFAHWVWGGGWLAQLGRNYGVGEGFVDTGGAGTIQAVGGLTALAVVWILGPRRGKYTREGMPSAIPGHNSVLVLFGCVLALVGWCGLNSAGALLFNGAAPGDAVLAAVNTILSAAGAALTTAALTHTRFGKPDASLTANGWIAGLVASSGGCAFMLPVEAAAIGMAAGGLVTLSVEWFELRMSVDDPGGAISVHAVAGVWGLIAAGLFARIPARSLDLAGESTSAHSGQFLAQCIGVATLIGFVLPLTFAVNWLLNRVYPLRVSAEGERQGMDLHELGAGAYPEFITHNDES